MPKSDVTPIYTADNCKAAYQLNWSLAIFWREAVQTANWLAELQVATERDGVRVLEHRFLKPGVSQLLLSSRPHVSPERLVWSVKGRLQHLVRREHPKAFRRNYGLRSVGSASREVVEQYVGSQTSHHLMSDRSVQEMVHSLQINNPQTDLSEARRSGHALYWYNLHVCFVNEGRCREVRRATLQAMRNMILRAAEKKKHLLSRTGILTDHLHLALACNLQESPADVALSYMNKLAYVCGSKQVFSFGFYVGTFGEYDLGATRL
jgi:REP element-mobilizing transposase RayT